MENKINVLSLFDGMSCGQIALNRANVNFKNYYASEIKSHAIKHVKNNFPNTIHIGDVRTIDITKLEKIDLLIAGTPCRGVSRLNKNQEGLNHHESILFFEFYRIYQELKKINPLLLFFLEITHGHKEATNTITEIMRVNKISVNSKLVSAQNRPRYYWTNIKGFKMPSDKNITTEDILTFDGSIVPENRVKWLNSESGKKSISKGYTRVNPYPKTGCITASGHKKWNENYLFRDGIYKFLSISELEALQTLPKGYCKGLTYDEAYDLIGDGWTIDIIVEFFKNINSCQ